jgi:hypothetical protein
MGTASGILPRGAASALVHGADALQLTRSTLTIGWICPLTRPRGRPTLAPPGRFGESGVFGVVKSECPAARGGGDLRRRGVTPKGHTSCMTPSAPIAVRSTCQPDMLASQSMDHFLVSGLPDRARGGAVAARGSEDDEGEPRLPAIANGRRGHGGE